MTVFPLYFLIITSIKPYTQQFTSPPILIPNEISLEALNNIFNKWNFTSYLINSIVITIGSVVLSLALGVPMAYSLVRFKFPRNINQPLAFFILSVRMLPPIVGIIPIFIIFRSLGLNDTFQGLIIAYTVFNLPFTVWIMRGFFLELPRDFEEAALVDGGSYLRTFIHIVLPVSLPAILTTASLCIIQSWNEFIFAVFMTSQYRKTIPVLISSYIGDQQFFWAELTTTASLAVIPVFILILIVQRELVKGLTFGAVKG
jgi:multiple sugar transport system permease protein